MSSILNLYTLAALGLIAGVATDATLPSVAGLVIGAYKLGRDTEAHARRTER